MVGGSLRILRLLPGTKKCDGINLDPNPPLLITGFPTRFVFA
jgi:hypothetical protein